MRVALLGLATLGACSIPEIRLDGKQCPCAEGYACDTLTNLCRPMNDGGGIVDTPSGTQCLPGSTVEIYRYASTFDWTSADNSWTGAAEIVQSSTNAMNAYAFKVNSELTQSMGNYRVISTLRPTTLGAGNPSLGIVLRAQLSLQNKSRYACNWVTKARELRIDATNGGNTVTLGMASVPGASQDAPVTMEAAITGNPPTLSCCLREYSTARVMSVMDPGTPIETGYPGLGTDRMAAAFPSFVVLQP